MKLVDRQETVIVVVGGGEGRGADRAAAQALQQAIDARGGAVYRRALIVDDEAYLDRPELCFHPTIAVGGPGVNSVTGRIVAISPTIWQSDEQAFVQGEVETARPRLAIWGMNAAATAHAVDVFMGQGLLDVVLDRIWQTAPGGMM